jgi:hypothetical protein
MTAHCTRIFFVLSVPVTSKQEQVNGGGELDSFKAGERFNQSVKLLYRHFKVWLVK